MTFYKREPVPKPSRLAPRRNQGYFLIFMLLRYWNWVNNRTDICAKGSVPTLDLGTGTNCWGMGGEECSSNSSAYSVFSGEQPSNGRILFKIVLGLRNIMRKGVEE